MKRKRILLADDHKIFLEGMRKLLETDFHIVGTAMDGRELVTAARQFQPDVVVTDISMPTLNGIEAARQIKKTDPQVFIVFLTMHLDTLYASQAFDAGGSGFVLKNSASRELITAINEAVRGRTYVSPLIAGDLISYMKAGKLDGVNGPTKLTPRQREILQLLSEGMSAKEIATSLNISHRTVEHHKYKMMRILKLHSTSGLVRYAMEKKMIGV